MIITKPTMTYKIPSSLAFSSMRNFSSSPSPEQEENTAGAKATDGAEDGPSNNASTSESATTGTSTGKKKDTTNSLQDAVNRIQDGSAEKETMGEEQGDEKSNNKSENDDGSINFDSTADTAKSMFSEFTSSLGDTWGELLASGNRQHINKVIRKPQATAEGDLAYEGPVAIMVIDPSENLTEFEKMKKRLTDAPIIQDILNRGEQMYEKSGAKDAKYRMDDIREDAKEVWETSQNPWVYRASSVYETITADTPESIAVQELRKLDPDFTLEDWRRDVVAEVLPQLMEWFLKGKTNQLKPWFGESVFTRIAAEIEARKKDHMEINSSVLGIMNSDIIACELGAGKMYSDASSSPIIVLHFMCQQINCVTNTKTNKIVEGSEDDIRANSYIAAFQREHDEEAGALNWKIVDFRLNGAIAYI